MLIFDNIGSSKHYRSKTDIVAEILTVAKEKPVNKIRLMYSAFLSSVQTREYIAELRSKKLLSFDEENKMYHTTKEGLEYIRLYEEMKRLGSD